MKFGNQLLTKLLGGILSNKPVRLEAGLLDLASFEEAIRNVPLSLSETQRNAIYNAWSNEVSYIQGPPGTGKSHTIAAIMLTALFLNKKVLLVSQKKAAIDVVRDKIRKLLGNQTVTEPMLYLGSSSEDRRKSKAYVESVLDRVRRRAFDAELLQKKSDLDLLEKEIGRQRKAVESDTSRLRDAIEVERLYFDENSKFIGERDSFCSNFDIPNDPDGLPLSNEDIEWKAVEKNLAVISRIERVRLTTGKLSKLELLRTRQSYARYQRRLYGDKDLIQRLGTTYIDQLVDLTKQFQLSQATVSRISIDTSKLRIVIDRSNARLMRLLEQYVVAKNEYDLLAELRRSVVANDWESVDQFGKMLYNVAPNLISQRMKLIDYSRLTDAFKLWGGEIKDLGLYLSFAPEIFDLVIVDESSQVNIAEIVPAFYRGKRFCVVGDEKQLGLSAAGLFALNKTYERLTWNKYFHAGNTISIEGAKNNKLLVSDASILDFITSPVSSAQIPHTMLDEHFRSMPQLADFTSSQFYDGNLKIMTAIGENVHKKCFRAIKVDGLRSTSGKFVLAEIDAVVAEMRKLMQEANYKTDADLKLHGFTEQNKPSIGILSFLTDQVREFRERLVTEFDPSILKEFNVFVGTPEEFQGNERNIMFITLGLDGVSAWGRQHYENDNRFNVATSRAINFVFLVYAGVPANAGLIRQFMRHFGVSASEEEVIPKSSSNEQFDERIAYWRYNEAKFESEFESRVYEILSEFVQHQADRAPLKLYNQVPSCGKRLDFVLFNEKNKKCTAIEVDGKQHFEDDGKSYSEGHLERIAVLKRAGWKIVHVPYYKWYNRGWLCDAADGSFQTAKSDLFKELWSAVMD